MNADLVVVDASLALKWVFDEGHSPEARRLLNRWRDEGTGMLAPTLFFYEVANALAKRIRRSELTMDDARDHLGFLIAAGPSPIHSTASHARALELIQKFELPAAYDAHYLALAESEECEFWTADQRLWNSVKRELNWVRWLGETHLDPASG